MLGIAMLFVAGLIGLFPKELPKKRKERVTSTTPKVLQKDDVFIEENMPLRTRGSINNGLNNTEFAGSMMELPPTLKGIFIFLCSFQVNQFIITNFRFPCGADEITQK